MKADSTTTLALLALVATGGLLYGTERQRDEILERYEQDPMLN